MVIHKTSKAVFKETFMGDFYLLEGLNIGGSFRISHESFMTYFSNFNEDNLSKVRPDMKLWRRFLVYIIGYERQQAKARQQAIADSIKNAANAKNEDEVLGEVATEVVKEEPKKDLGRRKDPKEDLLGIEYIANELNLEPTKVRSLLRKRGVPKPSIGWKWEPKEINDIIALVK